MLRGLGRSIEGGCWVPVGAACFPLFCLSARCLTLTRAGDECNLWQPMELTDSWESELPAVKVSIFKAHQLQWEGSRTAHMPALTAKQENFLLQTNTHTHIGQPPFCKETSKPGECNCCVSLSDCAWIVSIICMNVINFSPILSVLYNQHFN